jgi:hypothetical protein
MRAWGAAQDEESTLAEQASDTQPTDGGPETGHAPVNGLHMYYEITARVEFRCS